VPWCRISYSWGFLSNPEPPLVPPSAEGELLLLLHLLCSQVKSYVMLDDDEPDTGVNWETMAETLQKAGVSWRLYQEVIDLRIDSCGHAHERWLVCLDGQL
jgi:hypothetical protein